MKIKLHASTSFLRESKWREQREVGKLKRAAERAFHERYDRWEDR